MKKYLIAILMGCTAVHAEWYRVDSVPAYNTIKAVQANGEKEPMVIRIRNLEKIEYIQPKSERVLIGGVEARSLAQKILKGQLVWVENLQAEEGAYVADVYPSFEQVVTAYKERRILNGTNISKSTQGKLKVIYKQMLADINLTPLFTGKNAQAQQTSKEVRKTLYGIYARMLADIRSDNPKLQTKSANPEEANAPKQYAGGFQRALFTADAIMWFMENGQNMQPQAQKVFVDLLASFQSEADTEARYTHIKLSKIMEKKVFQNELFMNKADFERGKFSYTCLEWFKNRGQYLPDDVQTVFINWLRIYQQTHSNQGGFMKQRLQWMMDNNKLYLDFMELGN